jgi:hypothetical protein
MIIGMLHTENVYSNCKEAGLRPSLCQETPDRVAGTVVEESLAQTITLCNYYCAGRIETPICAQGAGSPLVQCMIPPLVPPL